MNRRELANRAIILAGGTGGFSINYDPDGLGEMVTEGRWRLKDAKGRYLSCCQDLPSRLALEACEMRQKMAWCNRKDGGNTWIPGFNLLRIKQHAAYAWKNYAPGSKWDIRLGDAVEVQNSYGPHVFVITEIKYGPDGTPVSCDHADYGQSHRAGDKPAGPSGRVYLDHPIAKNALGNWMVNGNRIIGRLDILAIREHELGLGEDEETVAPAPSELPPTAVVIDPPPDKWRPLLMLGMSGPDVQAWTEVLVRDGFQKAPGARFTASVKAATKLWQATHKLKADGVIGPKTRGAI